MKKLLLLSAFAFFAYASYAQVSFGVTAGVNAATISQNYAESDEESDTKMRLAPRIGVTVDYTLSDALSLRSGLAYSSKGYSADLESEYEGAEVDGYARSIVNYLEIPITAVYRTGSLEIVAGPYLAFGLSGKNKADYEVTADGGSMTIEGESDIEFASEYPDDSEEGKEYIKGFDAGISLGLGYNVGPGVVSLSYSKGFVSRTPDFEGSDDYKETNSVIGVSFTYFFNK